MLLYKITYVPRFGKSFEAIFIVPKRKSEYFAC